MRGLRAYLSGIGQGGQPDQERPGQHATEQLFQAVARAVGHVDVDQHDVGTQPGGELQCFLGGRGRPCEFKSLFAFHEIGECAPHLGVPLHDKNSFYLRVTPLEITPLGGFHLNT